jgi:hypothetical protein
MIVALNVSALALIMFGTYASDAPALVLVSVATILTAATTTAVGLVIGAAATSGSVRFYASCGVISLLLGVALLSTFVPIFVWPIALTCGIGLLASIALRRQGRKDAGIQQAIFAHRQNAGLVARVQTLRARGFALNPRAAFSFAGAALIAIGGTTALIWAGISTNLFNAVFEQNAIVSRLGILVSGIPFLLILLPAGALVLQGRRALQLDVLDALARDKRRPILLLRSFQDDDRWRVAIAENPFVGVLWSSAFLRTLTLTGKPFLEELVVGVLRHRGPVIAIGRPAERTRPLGAARSYHSDDDWRAVIEERLRSCSRVAVIPGLTENIAWEFARARDIGVIHKLIIIFPPVAYDGQLARWYQLEKAFPQFRGCFDEAALYGGRSVLTCTIGDAGIHFFTCSNPREDSYELSIEAALAT